MIRALVRHLSHRVRCDHPRLLGRIAGRLKFSPIPPVLLPALALAVVTAGTKIATGYFAAKRAGISAARYTEPSPHGSPAASAAPVWTGESLRPGRKCSTPWKTAPAAGHDHDMTEESWATFTGRGTVLVLTAVAICLGGVVGFARNLPRALNRVAAWRRESEEHPASSAAVLTLLIVTWPLSAPFLAWRGSAKGGGTP